MLFSKYNYVCIYIVFITSSAFVEQMSPNPGDCSKDNVFPGTTNSQQNNSCNYDEGSVLVPTAKKPKCIGETVYSLSIHNFNSVFQMLSLTQCLQCLLPKLQLKYC